MWGRITQMAEKLDDTFGTDEGRMSSSPSSHDDGDGDGWDDADDFDDDLDTMDFADPHAGNEHDDAHRSSAEVARPEERHESPTVVEAPSAEDVARPTIERGAVVTASAPGKALIAGGYLVLESPNPGVVLAVRGCRFHCTVMFRPSCWGGDSSELASGDDDWAFVPLDVYSPQFHQVFSYVLSYSLTSKEDLNGDGDVTLLQLRADATSDAPRNKFVERSLLLSLGYIRKSVGLHSFHLALQTRQPNTSLAIKLRADNDFYSQIPELRKRGLDLTPQNVDKLEPFLPCPRDETTGKIIVNKTGLGSSAALVTSLVGGLLQFFGVVSLPSMRSQSETLINGKDKRELEGRRISHNLAQVCHCYAQGKIGSGFDVSSAVYGSHIYTRFSKDIMDTFLEVVDKENAVADELRLSAVSSQQLLDLINDESRNRWDCTVTPFVLPPGIEFIMADVCGGSESPSMAKKVLDWKKNNRKVGFLEDYYWKDLKRCNKRIASLLTKEFASASLIDGLRRDGAQILANRTAEQWKKPMPSSWHEFEGSSWDVAGKLLDLRMALLESRQNLKGMGNAAGVPIEPDKQTELADATMKLPGVISAGVPGAGGYDALFVIYVKGADTAGGESDQVRDAIGNLWREFSSSDGETVVCPLTARAGGYGAEDGLCITELDW
ncbi:hypothetical protein HJC23_008971 [Cyclotella cryptica]|uniref:phosphomevalonate kinase n=1 Tax=Cyclotella cryptica TaxID=29204 RepID=A0ABD3QYC5_9STRA|eukprot:CCRYP_000547-RA/>CCRYP_000547-RA protein AED:0.12 eAED:0.12 QI:0/-1/0/1/-1/1/1/0/664